MMAHKPSTAPAAFVETGTPRSLSEVRSLTGLRGVAAIYVLLFHYFPLVEGDNPTSWPARILDHGYLAVDLFFVLSGFVMAMNYGRAFAHGSAVPAYLRFLGRRIARIYPLYFIATIAGFLLVHARVLPYTHVLPPTVALGANLLMIQAWGLTGSFDSPAWSISAEWAAYLLFPALLIPALFRRRVWAWVIGILCAGTLGVLCSLPAAFIPDYLVHAPLNCNGYWMALPVVRCIAEFTLGILAFRVAGSAVGRWFGVSPWIAPALCVAALGTLAVPRGDLCFVLLLPLVVLSLTSEKTFIGRCLASPPIELLGVLSYSIYLTHKLLLGVLERLSARGEAAGLAHAHTYAAAACAALTFGLAFAAYHLIEKPGRSRLRALFEGAAATSRARTANSGAESGEPAGGAVFQRSGSTERSREAG